MRKFKRFLRMTGYVLLIILALFGIGLAGGIPIPSHSKNQQVLEINIEMVEDREEENEDGEEKKLE